jgi:hypothetical protein
MRKCPDDIIHANIDVPAFLAYVPSMGCCLDAPQQQQQQQGRGQKVVTSMVALFQPTPVPQYTLKRVYTIATHVLALVSGEFGSPQQSAAHKQEQRDFCSDLRRGFTYRKIVDYLYDRVLEHREIEADTNNVLTRDCKIKLAAAIIPRGLVKVALRTKF